MAECNHAEEVINEVQIEYSTDVMTSDRDRRMYLYYQLSMEDYLQMVSAEQKEYAEVFDYSKITEKSGVITD
jgi:hypothetical protein